MHRLGPLERTCQVPVRVTFFVAVHNVRLRMNILCPALCPLFLLSQSSCLLILPCGVDEANIDTVHRHLAMRLDSSLGKLFGGADACNAVMHNSR